MIIFSFIIIELILILNGLEMENIYINDTILKLFPNGEVWKFGFKRNTSKEKTWHFLKGSILINKSNYKHHLIKINKKQYTTSRLLAYAFLRFDLNEKADTIDHINRNSLDNHIYNLRCASRTEQALNTSTIINANGCYLTSSGRYQAHICINYKIIYLGTYDTVEEAHNAYLEAVKSRL